MFYKVANHLGFEDALTLTQNFMMNLRRNWGSYRTDRNELVWVVHHCNEKIEENNYVDDGEAAEHDETPESSELLDAVQLKVIQVDKAKWRPE